MPLPRDAKLTPAGDAGNRIETGTGPARLTACDSVYRVSESLMHCERAATVVGSGKAPQSRFNRSTWRIRRIIMSSKISTPAATVARPSRIAATLVAAWLAAACDAPLMGAPADAGGRLDPGRPSASTAPIAVVLPDSVIQVGDQMLARVVDAEITAAARFRQFAPQVTWESSDSAIVAVSPSGMLTGVSAGPVTIRARWLNRTGTASLHARSGVPPAPPTPEDPTPPDPQEPPPTNPTPPPLPPQPPQGGVAEPPRVWVTVPTAEGNGTTRRVRNGQSLQAAVDAAQPGDVILLEPGAVFDGLRLRRKTSGNGWITIRTEGTPTASGRRVQLGDSTRFARVRSPGGNTPAITTEAGAEGYWLVNLDVTPHPSQTSLNTLVNLGEGGAPQTSLASVPTRIVLDRMLVRGYPNFPLTRCIALQSAHTAVLNSAVVECHVKGFDSQAIVGWNGPGPFLIENNLLEGAGENVMFGGATPAISGLNPSDIVIRWNHFRKPVAWFASRQWSVKNILELKQGVRVLVQQNLFENNWVDAQAGIALAFWSVNQSNQAPWSQTADVIFVENVVRNSVGGVALTGTYSTPAVPMRRVHVARNLFYRMGFESDFGGQNQMVTILQAVSDVHIEENTFVGSQTAMVIPGDGNPPKGDNFRYARNVATFGPYGVFGSGSGLTTIATRYNNFAFTDNCFLQIVPTYWSTITYPGTNRGTTEPWQASLPNLLNGDASIAPSSPCAGMLPGGTTPGAPVTLLPFIEGRIVTGLGGLP